MFFLDNPKSVALTLEILSPIFPCTVSRPEEAFKIGENREPLSSAVVVVVNQTGLDTCCDVLQRFVRSYPKVPIMVLTDTVEPLGVARLLGCGAFDFADLQGSPSETLLRMHRIVGSLPPQSTKFDPQEDAVKIDPELRRRLIGNAPKFLELLKRLCAMARTHTSVMLLGETGTGKEVCAQAIHYCSPRASGPWVAVNCAAIPTELMEDELYGHVRGAYTHAHATRSGLVCEANGGTLLLDEVDSLPLSAQAKLLRFLQDGEYRAVGSNSVRRADVRVLAASNTDLRMAVANGRFREDLFFRLNTLSLIMPPLRERREDMAALASHFLDQANLEVGRRLLGISPAALHRLLHHTWPGNIRELKHVIQRAVVLAQSSILQATDIEIDGQPTAEPPTMLSFREAKARAVESFERYYLEHLLAQNQGNITHAAHAARKNRRAFFELLRRYSIDASRFRMS